MKANVSACGRFVVLDALYIDRNVFEALANWAAERGLDHQAAIQLAIYAFNDSARDTARTTAAPRASGAHRDRPHDPAMGSTDV